MRPPELTKLQNIIWAHYVLRWTLQDILDLVNTTLREPCQMEDIVHLLRLMGAEDV